MFTIVFSLLVKNVTVISSLLAIKIQILVSIDSSDIAVVLLDDFSMAVNK